MQMSQRMAAFSCRCSEHELETYYFSSNHLFSTLLYTIKDGDFAGWTISPMVRVKCNMLHNA